MVRENISAVLLTLDVNIPLKLIYTDLKRIRKRFFLWSLSLVNVNIELDSLWTHLEVTWLSLSSQHKRRLIYIRAKATSLQMGSQRMLLSVYIRKRHILCHGLSLLEMHSGGNDQQPWCHPTSLGVLGVQWPNTYLLLGRAQLSSTYGWRSLLCSTLTPVGS